MSQIIWRPTSNSKIFNLRSLHIKNLDAVLSNLSFLQYEAILIESSLVNELDNEHIALFDKLKKFSFTVIIRDHIEKFCPSKKNEYHHLNVVIENTSQLRLLHNTTDISWITYKISNSSDVKFFISEDFTHKNIPIFFELKERPFHLGRLHTLDLTNMLLPVLNERSQLPIIHSIEDQDQRLRDSLFWDLPPYIEKLIPNVKPKISIIIPTHNRGKYLIPLLNSILNLEISKAEVEVLIIDDGSSDQTKKLLLLWNKVKNEFINFRYYYIPRKEENAVFINRVSSIRNFGASKAKADILLFLDSDILLPPDIFNSDKLELPIDCVLQPYRLDLSQEETQNILENDNDCTFIKTKMITKEAIDNYLKLSDPKADYVTWAASYFWLMPKNLFIEAAGFRLAYITYGWEDVDFIFKLKSLGKNLIPCPLPVWHLNTLSDSSEYKNVEIDRRIQLEQGSEIYFRSTLSLRSIKCFLFFVFRRILVEKYFLNQDYKSLNAVSVEETSSAILVGKKLLSNINFSEIFLGDYINSDLKIIISKLEKLDLKITNLLIIGLNLDFLPTHLLQNKTLGIKCIRRVFKNQLLHFSDNFINFFYLQGWTFKSGECMEQKIINAMLSLVLHTDAGEQVSSGFVFDTCLVQDFDYFCEIQKFDLIPKINFLFFVDASYEELIKKHCFQNKLKLINIERLNNKIIALYQSTITSEISENIY